MKHRSVNELIPGDYVKDLNGSLHKIKSIYGVRPNGSLAKPSEGGFGVITESGKEITMWQASAYHKASDVDGFKVCVRCKSSRIADVNGKTNDMCAITICDKDRCSDVPSDMNIGGGDYLEFSFCLNCGQLQGSFPLPHCEMENVSCS